MLAQVYAVALTAGNEAYLVRFDNVTFEYVAYIQKYSYSATFDRENGDFFLINQDDMNDKMLFRYSNVHSWEGSIDIPEENSANMVDADDQYDYTADSGTDT